MQIQALKFTAASSNTFLRRTLVYEQAQDLEKLRQESHLAVFLVTIEDLARVRSFGDMVIDRGQKDKRKGLAMYLLGHKKIPLIEGSYDASGQLVRSIRKLLENASRKKEENIYFIGIDGSRFDTLKTAVQAPEKHSTPQELPMSQAAPTPEDRSSPEEDQTPEECPIPREAAASQPPTAAYKPAFSSHDEGMPGKLLRELRGRFEEPAGMAERYVGRSEEAQLVRMLIVCAARVETPVLIQGDTGTGKDVVAREIHRYSSRAGRKFVTINCGAIPTELLELELFGCEQDSLQKGYPRKIGLWEYAGDGTLFLDEIGDLQLGHQGKILRALATNTIRRISGNEDIPVAARILAATNRDLFAMIQTKEFREDLYYRLRNGFIHTVPLRKHPDDIPLLAQVFWNRITKGAGKELPRDILDLLQSHSWPGNVRDLKHMLNNLAQMFGIEGLTAMHLEFIAYMYGVNFRSRETASGEKDVIHRAECLLHLRQVNEATRAAEVAVLSTQEANEAESVMFETAMNTLEFRRHELEALCGKPAFFYSKETYLAIWNLTGRLNYFRGIVLKDRQEAKRYWKEDLSGEFRQATGLVLRELGLLHNVASNS